MHINYFHNHETLLIKFGSFYMVDSGIGQGLTSHCHAQNNLPETRVSINQTKSCASQREASSCQQFLKSEIHNSNLTTHYAYQLFSQP